MKSLLFFFAIIASFLLNISFANAAKDSLQLANMTWPEVQAAITAGKTTVIVPTGGTEQTGPHIVLGKHNFILTYTSGKIAERLGDALLTPIIQYVPEGDISPPTGHMRFAGTLSLRPETFAALLEDTARSLKQHGFKIICFVGEHGGSQQVQKHVADKLNEEWKNTGVKVLHVSDYYDEHNGQAAWYHTIKPDNTQDIETHGGLADTSEMLVAYSAGVRNSLRKNFAAQDMEISGAEGSALDADETLGKKFLELKINAAVRQIKANGG